MTMRLHERTLPVNRAAAEFRAMVWQWVDGQDLTYAEFLGMVLDLAQGVKKHMLREERHPGEPDKKADEA